MEIPHYMCSTNPLRGNSVVTTVLQRGSSGIGVRSREAGVFHPAAMRLLPTPGLYGVRSGEVDVFDPALLCSLSGTGR